ncbi:modular serine protease-like [Achroia grisella]|uniref:modular serine protease-like n=1 Tax=Achroia grisella TaxID=688607 RepID=UPI0027D23BCC|nr:modular serine protease-like [Achroia grisella]
MKLVIFQLPTTTVRTTTLKLGCQNNWFQCTYGACVDGTAPCNGVQDCADNSDELHPRCRNESLPILFFKCHNGEQIPVSDQCDGVRHCSDGSDERVETCVAQTCFPYLFQCAYGACVDRGSPCNGACFPYLFQCAYGSCVDRDSPCNGVRDCADGSDESEELCHNVVATDDSNKYNDNKSPTQPGVCILPSYPKNGRYRVTNGPNDFPGQSADMYLLNVSCHQGYRLAGDSTVYCFQGYWVPENLPKCLRSCRFTPHPSVEYSCLSDRSSQRRRACNAYEPDGTVIRTRCRPDYNGRPRTMRCVDGNWNSIPQCSMHHQDGTNITILVKDQVEVHISGIQYASNDVTEKKEVEDDSSYDIDEGDLRIDE